MSKPSSGGEVGCLFFKMPASLRGHINPRGRVGTLGEGRGRWGQGGNATVLDLQFKRKTHKMHARKSIVQCGKG